ncbi:MAG: NUDIX hydrolase [Bacteroidetes bacterium]|nr:MAG: NUDIX hydrolase [Bacteroidota bacterium]
MHDFALEGYHPGLSLDCVIFGFHENELKVLLLKMKNWDKWALPGGFVPKNMGVDEAAAEALFERTGLKDIFLRQFYLFGNPERNNADHVEKLVKRGVIQENLKSWFSQRFVSMGYYSLVEFSKVTPVPDTISEFCEWKPLSDLPPMIIDHEEILQRAYQTLKKELDDEPVWLNLLPEKFTMTELQTLYETILGKQLDRRNFRRKILSWEILVETGERRTGGRHKAPILYQFDLEKYDRALREGLKQGW